MVFYVKRCLAWCLLFIFVASVYALPFGVQSPKEKAPSVLKPEKIVPQLVIVHLNAATVEELTKLKGIGPEKAQAIVAYRERYGHFKAVEDLLKVKGIGPAILRDNKENLRL